MSGDAEGVARTWPTHPNRLSRIIYRSLLRGRPAGVSPASLYWRLAGRYREQYMVRVEGYSPPIKPYKTIDLDPASVERLTGRPYPPWEDRFASLGTVRGGDWDRRPLTADPDRHPSVRIYGGRDVRETVLYRSLSARIEHDTAWEKTELFDVLRAELDDGRSVWHGCRTEADLRRRCEGLDELRETIDREGFNSQLALARQSGTSPDPDAFARIMRHEVAVDIGRDGEPRLVEGKHRLMLADLLGIESVPAVVYVRHPEWMERRQAVADEGVDAGSHPDLRTMPT